MNLRTHLKRVHQTTEVDDHIKKHENDESADLAKLIECTDGATGGYKAVDRSNTLGNH